MNSQFWLRRPYLAGLLLVPGLALAAPFAYIPNGGSNNVSVIDTASNSVVTTTAVGSGPVGAEVNASGTRVYVSNSLSNNVSVIDAATNAVIATVPVGASPFGVAVNPVGSRVYVANYASNNISVIDTTTNSVVATVPVGMAPGAVAVNPAGTRVYVANSNSNGVSVIDAGTNTVVATIPFGSSPQVVAVNPAGTRVYVTNDSPDAISIIDTATNSVVGSVAVSSSPFVIAVNPAGTRAYVSDPNTNSVSIVDLTTNAVVATVTVGAFPAGLAVNPSGTRVYVANARGNSVSVIDTTSNTVVATITAGQAPVAIGKFIGPGTAVANNYQGLWWNAAESGWGINFAHQGDQVFATWYTYDTSGKAWWLSMLAARTTPTSNAYTGTIYVDSGPPFNNFVGAGAPTAVGNGTLTFTDANDGSFAYTVNGVSQTKAITRFDLGTGPQPTCAYGNTTPNFAAATNYQDLWWVPNGVESGWGVNFAHQGNSLFATWYTYNVLGGTPLWLSTLAQRQGTSSAYTGPIYQNSGPRFDAYDTTKVVTNPVGTATFTFADGNDAVFGYTVMVAPLPGPVTQSKQITRFPFAATGGTVCQ